MNGQENEIMVLAKHAGFYDAETLLFSDELEAFAKLVAAKEREACAKVCVELPAALEEFGALNRAAKTIRARGEA